jgi:hypothetical protein
VPLSSSFSSYLSPQTSPLLSCSRPSLPFLPSASSNRTTRCHGRRRPCSPWAAIISPSPLSSTPCRASPLPTGAPRPHPSANPSPDRPTDVHRRPSSAAASASPSTRPSSSSHRSPITLAGLHHLEEAPRPPHRASLTPSMPEHRRRDQARPPPALLRPPGFNRANPKVALVSLMLPHLSLVARKHPITGIELPEFSLFQKSRPGTPQNNRKNSRGLSAQPMTQMNSVALDLFEIYG